MLTLIRSRSTTVVLCILCWAHKIPVSEALAKVKYLNIFSDNKIWLIGEGAASNGRTKLKFPWTAQNHGAGRSLQPIGLNTTTTLTATLTTTTTATRTWTRQYSTSNSSSITCDINPLQSMNKNKNIVFISISLRYESKSGSRMMMMMKLQTVRKILKSTRTTR